MKLSILIKLLKILIKLLESEKLIITDDKINDIVHYISFLINPDEKLSTYQVLNELKISRKTLYNYIREGKLKEGMSQAGFKEKFFYRSDIENLKLSLHTS